MPISPDPKDFAKDFLINMESLMHMMILDLLTVPPADVDIGQELSAEYIEQMEQVKEVEIE